METQTLPPHCRLEDERWTCQGVHWCLHLHETFICSVLRICQSPSICLQQEVTVLLYPVLIQECKVDLIHLTPHWGSSAVPCAVQGGSYLKDLQLPLFLIWAVSHGGEETCSGEIMRSVCMGRNGRGERGQMVFFHHLPICPSRCSTCTHTLTDIPQSSLFLSILPW